MSEQSKFIPPPTGAQMVWQETKSEQPQEWIVREVEGFRMGFAIYEGNKEVIRHPFDQHLLQTVAAAHKAALAAQAYQYGLAHGREVFEVWNKAAQEIEKLRHALEWYATATYPDDGSGRPPDAYRKIATDALKEDK